jgi:hypothetical protein
MMASIPVTAFEWPGASGQVALDGVHVAFGVASEDASAVSLAAQLGDHVAAQCAGLAGDQDVHLLLEHRDRERR